MIVSMCIMIRLAAQPFALPDALKIYNADELMKIAKNKGIQELEKSIDPINLVYLDSSYAQTIIDLEFKTKFLDKHPYNNKVVTYELPKLTIKLAEQFNIINAQKKLFEYYCNIPKFIKSDTIYYIYNHLDDFLKELVKINSPRLIARLKHDYNIWCELARKSPKKIYPTIEEMRKIPFKESHQFKPSDLLVDCNYISLQIAGALNYLKIKAFDDSLIEKLKAKQSNPFARKYEFPKPYFIESKRSDLSKTIQNVTSISNFRKDFKKVEKLILDNYENCCDSRICEILYKGPRACVTILRNNGSDFYTVELNTDKTILIDFIGSLIE